MKLHLRHAVWALALAFTMAVLVTPMIVAAQSEQGLEHGRGHDKSDQGKDRDDNNANSSNYQQGWNHGQEDRANNRVRRYHVRFDNDRDRRAYESGYDQGYQGNGTYGRYPDRNGQYDRDGQRNEPYRSGTYGNGPNGNNVQNVAYNNGFQTGMGYGQADRNNGHSNRPTYSSTYQDGTKGYNSSYGSQTVYKNSFRQGYQAGYARGYGAGQTQGYRR